MWRNNPYCRLHADHNNGFKLLRTSKQTSLNYSEWCFVLTNRNFFCDRNVSLYIRWLMVWPKRRQIALKFSLKIQELVRELNHYARRFLSQDGWRLFQNGGCSSFCQPTRMELSTPFNNSKWRWTYNSFSQAVSCYEKCSEELHSVYKRQVYSTPDLFTMQGCKALRNKRSMSEVKFLRNSSPAKVVNTLVTFTFHLIVTIIQAL